jgi:acyl-CoA reductase-like NAD-dependent aldehyde dehydrogenase
MLIESINPTTGELLGKVESAEPGSFPCIVEEARKAQKDWTQLSQKLRIDSIKRFGQILFGRKREIADLISRENGKPVVEAYTSELIPVLDMTKYFSKTSQRVFRPRRVKIGIPLLKTKKAFVANEPYGVVGIISAWNYPLLLPLGQILPALLGGNAVIFKPSERAPIVGEMISQMIWDSEIPKKVFNIVQGAGEVGAALAASGVDKLFFTGSSSTGKRVSELAAKTLTPVSLELGSKDAAIVLDDANLESAASGIIWGAFMNAGQTCVSIERCFVHQKIFNQFVKVLSQKIKALRIGPGANAETDVGAMIHRDQFDVVKHHVTDAIQRGATVVNGGIFTDGTSRFVPPTLLTDVTIDSLLMTEETFGPVLPVIKFSSDEEAVALANSSRFGLSVSIWTRDTKRGMNLTKDLQAGATIVNDVISYYGISDGVVGGVKESGNGRVHGKEGLLEMVRQKYYEIERMPRMKKLWWYSYNQNMLSFFETATDFLFAHKIVDRIKALFKLIPEFLRIKKT